MRHKKILSSSAILTCAIFFLTVIPVMAAGTADGFNSYGLDDPMSGASVPQIIARLISWALPLVGSLFLAMFIWGGFTYLTASGESDRVKKATQTLKNAVIGLAIVSLAYVLVFNIIDVLGRAMTGSSGADPNAPQAQAK